MSSSKSSNPFEALKALTNVRRAVAAAPASDKKSAAALRFADAGIRLAAQKEAQKASEAASAAKGAAKGRRDVEGDVKRALQENDRKRAAAGHSLAIKSAAKSAPTSTPKAPKAQKPASAAGAKSATLSGMAALASLVPQAATASPASLSPAPAASAPDVKKTEQAPLSKDSKSVQKGAPRPERAAKPTASQVKEERRDERNARAKSVSAARADQKKGPEGKGQEVAKDGQKRQRPVKQEQAKAQSAAGKDRTRGASTPSSSKPAARSQERESRDSRESRNPQLPNPVTVPVTLAPGLPVSEHGEELVEAIRSHQVIIVCGETGSGKTTQLPKICLLAGRGTKGLIGHTQPRRIAASSIAKRIAKELNTEVGEVVGYKVRFTDKTMPGAAIKLMTDGILLAETQTDPLLKRYDTIIIDEAHERSINIDFLLGYLKRILVRRRDLKVIVTSATIDAERFAKHFEIDGKPAPVYTIEGRTYPVEIRYRPVDDLDEDDDRTLMDAIADACDELEMAGRGDILVFLPGEREIREAAEVLRKRNRPGTVDILPLFARLSAEEQERVFTSGGLRRIVLATNVAETSITVPGIRYVVDTGLARVKRYSYRNKVEQLLIEPVSKASANQRAGRCGRVANGICIRLFDEASWSRRPDYTDPEIMRSNLAAVILRMKSLKLGDVRDFPFVQAPPARAIADGYAILAELNAIDKDGRLTETGRDLARLPVDPRLGRMLLEASRRGALKEALVIVSGLSIQDPRDRPVTAQDAADAAHKRFADERSDFLSYTRMWQWYETAFAKKASNRLFTDELHRMFLSPRRMREWRDVWRQLCELTSDIGWRVNTAPATYEELHRSLLTGLLGNLGLRQLDADFRAPPYLGARGIHFWIWPGSSLAKKAGQWVMAAELVETSRLFARCVAQIEPEWVEAAAAHLLKKSWSDPHWEKKRAEVVAFERGALYGMTVYSQRRVQFAPHDAKTAREIFIREALVEGDYETRAPFFSHNQKLVQEIRDLENKSRRPDVLVDEETIFQFYDALLDASVVGGSSFEKWRRTAEADNPKLLFLKKEDLMRHDASGVTAEYFPKKLEMAGVVMALTYHFEPGAPRDGVTLAVPLYALNQIDSVRCEWLVPGMLKEKVRSLLKSLPQRYRRHCVPLEQYAEGFFARTGGVQRGSQSLIDALIDDIREQTRVVCERTDFKLEFVPQHLFMNFKVLDEHGRQLAMGRNLAELRAELGSQAQSAFQHMAQADASIADDLADHITTWSFGELPELMEIKRGGQFLIGHPALVDRGEECSLEVFDDLDEARKAHRAGLRRLFTLQLKEQVRYLTRNLSGLQRVQMQCSVLEPVAKAFDSAEGLVQDVVAASIETAAMQEPWPVDAASFGARKDEARTRLTLIGGEYLRLMQDLAAELSQIPRKLQNVRGWPEAVKDVQAQLRELFPAHFLIAVDAEHVRHYVRYVRAINVRLDKLRNDPARDAAHMAEVQGLATAYYRELASRKGKVDQRLTQFRWLLEELRVSLFAQELKTPMPVSVKRLAHVWESIRRL